MLEININDLKFGRMKIKKNLNNNDLIRLKTKKNNYRHHN